MPSRVEERASGARAASLVAAEIRKDIVRGALRPGYLLPPEPRLIERFGVSRPTVREAVRILESERLVVVQRGATGGARVLQPGWGLISHAAGIALQAQGATLGDVYEARMLIEPAAAKRAAMLSPAESASALQAQIFSRYSAEGDVGDGVEPTPDFHRVLLEQAQSPTLSLIGAALANIVDRHERLVVLRGRKEAPAARRRRLAFAVRSYQKLVDLIGAGKGAPAERHWRGHMEHMRSFWLSELGDTQLVDLFE